MPSRAVAQILLGCGRRAVLSCSGFLPLPHAEKAMNSLRELSADSDPGPWPGLAARPLSVWVLQPTPAALGHLVYAACILCVLGPPHCGGEVGAAHAARRRRLDARRLRDAREPGGVSWRVRAEVARRDGERGGRHGLRRRRACIALLLVLPSPSARSWASARLRPGRTPGAGARAWSYALERHPEGPLPAARAPGRPRRAAAAAAPAPLARAAPQGRPQREAEPALGQSLRVY